MRNTVAHTVEACRDEGAWFVVSVHATLPDAYARLKSEWQRADNGYALRLTTRAKGAK